LLFSVPFYGPDGAFKGTITAIIRTKAIQKLLPSSGYALVNTKYSFVAASIKEGQQTASADWVALGEADPKLIFSTVLPLSINDPESTWQLWAGQPDEAFLNSAEIVAQRASLKLGMLSCGAIILMTMAVWALLKRRRQAERDRIERDSLEKAQKLAATRDHAKALDAELKVKMGELEGSQTQIIADGRKFVAQQNAIISSLGEALSRLATGDLTFQIQKDENDPYNQIKDDLSTAIEQLRKIAGSTASAVQQVAGDADKILTSVADLAERTEEQGAALMETAASMEEMSATVRQNADNAQLVKRAVVTVRDMSVKGSAIAAEAITAVAEIEGSSRQISAIIGFIEEIARQTNILALNAAVEAARAGEAGSGFAVIANEVRALSQRSSSALQDIKSVIASADQSVATGVNLVTRAGNALTDIAVSVNEVAERVADIANASMEQATGIEQVTRAVSEMDNITQQNAELAVETTKALEHAQTYVLDLRKAVSFFKISQGNVSPVARGQNLQSATFISRQSRAVR
jgi:methyl-accepting chemotaxis protein